jgi:hypothetical protein
MLAPFDDPEWAIWVLGNQLDQYDISKVDRIFEIHDNLEDKDPAYPNWLTEQGMSKLVVGDKFPLPVPDATFYPENKVNELLGGEYLSSSPAYMIALAILEGASEIGIYGVDMAVDNHEYFKQRPEMYAWIAYAKAKGIKITIPKESCLFKGEYVEGRDWGKKEHETFSEDQFLQMANLHKSRMEECEEDIRAIQARFNSHDGARQVYERLAKVARSGQKVNLTDTSIV